jgi:hypothetical protein
VKTISLKKVSAVAVASLGFGLLSVVPAQAATIAANNSVPAIATPFNVSVASGTAITAKAATFTIATGSVANDFVDFAVAASVKPSGSTAVPTLTVAATTTDATKATIAQGANAQTVTATLIGTGAISAAQNLGNIGFTPDIPGAYKLTITATSYSVTDTTRGTAILNSTVATYMVFATGTGARVASSGLGSTTASGVAGGQVKLNFVPALTTATNAPALTADTVWQVTSTGTGSIVNATGNIFAYASDGAGGAGGATATTGTNASPGTGFNLPTNGTAGDYSAGAKLGNGSTTTPLVFEITTSASVAGTQTLVISSISAATGAPTAVSTVTITWAATAAAASAGYSTSFISAGTACGVADATTGLSFGKSAAGILANICIAVKDSNGNAMVGQALSATVSGPGLISLVTGNTDTTTAGAVRAASLTATTQASTNLAKILIGSDGTSGTTTITITNGTTTIATETLYFYGTVATLTATQNLKVARASATGAVLGTSDGTGVAAAAITAALTPAVVIVAKDSAGVVVPSLTITGLSSDTTVISTATVLEAVGTALSTGAAGPGTYLASVTSAGNGTSGKTATVTFRTLLSTGAYISAAPLTFTLGGSLATGTETISFDKASYASGEAMKVTVTAKDSAGNAVYDGLNAPALTASKAIGGALPSGFYVGGVVTTTANTLFAPAIGGSFSVNGTSSNTAASAITASATVTDANAGLLTQIDALNAKIVALNALIAKIMKKLGVK